MQIKLGQKYLQIWVAFSALCGEAHLRKLLQIIYIQYQPYDNWWDHVVDTKDSVWQVHVHWR